MKIEPKDIVLFHVGGSLGSYGLIDKIIHIFPENCVVFGFEARQEEKDGDIKIELGEKKVRLKLINAFIGEEDGKEQEFYINKHPESSSAYQPNPEVFNEICLLPYKDDYPLWGSNTVLDYKQVYTTRSLKSIIEGEGVVPDVLSIDAQGSELLILKGIGKYIGEILTIVTEVEFFEIYKGQCLYQDQAALLQSHGFRLADISDTQRWYPRVVWGKGLLTVGEALWFKRLTLLSCDNLIKGIKFAAILYCLEYYSLSYLVIEKLKTFYGDVVKELCNELGYGIVISSYSYVKVLEEKAKKEWEIRINENRENNA